ncbi:Pantothenate synthetase [Methyloligella halotolerans]|uniref:Pantothenate synthetase n=1 Tax=Methyloligella halotolerans TaxID=1177755 RepID=A0A1E2S1T2_9HYPH|nr:pantoate--beta-alanine ligase [Methyloligella halotolerans]ODA68350.1 Pantothenate synthetase [Methyloligella halotolerans]
MAPAISTIRTVTGMRRRVAQWRNEERKIALVPTMGALHPGHLSLIAKAREKAERVIVSIFVNPTQFGEGEDFDAYPRDEKGDLAKLTEAGVDVAYIPDARQMFAPGFATRVHVKGLTERLCGASRPGHFDGVSTIVTKLLLQCAPDLAIFGEKDYQQLLTIKRMVADLDIPVEILGAPIEREEDGLARSSRNAYLNKRQRELAPLLQRTLQDMAYDLAEGRPVEDATAASAFRLESAGFKVDYLEVVDPETLQPVDGVLSKPARTLVAAYLGKTRLIDNLGVKPKQRNRKRAS